MDIINRVASSQPRPLAGSGPYGESGYDIAQLFSRFHKQVTFGSVGLEDSELTFGQRKRALVHAYQLARLYPYSYAAADRLARFVVGPDGIWPKPKTGSKRWDKKAAEKFKAHFDDPRLCDVRNRQTLPDMLKHLVSHVLLFAGDAGLRVLPGMRLNPYESDRIGPPAEDSKQAPRNEIQGVQVDISGEFTGFRVGRREAGGVSQSEIVPAAEMIFTARHLLHRFDQVRGVGAFMQAFTRFVTAGEITTAELRAMLASAKIAFYMPVEGIDEIEISKDKDGNPIYPNFQLVDGSILYGPPGNDPKPFKSDRPNSNFDSMLRNVWVEVASILGISYELLTGDWSKSNFSVIRGVRLSDMESVCEIQGWLRRTVLDRLFYWATSYWVKRGELPPPPKDFEGDAANYQVSWSFPKLEHIDPYKEHQSNRLHLENAGTLRDLYGDRWEEKLVEKADEVKRLNEIAEQRGIDPAELLRPISKERTITLAAGAEKDASDNGSEPTK